MIKFVAWLLMILPIGAGCGPARGPRPEWTVIVATMDGCLACKNDKPIVAEIDDLPGVIVLELAPDTEDSRRVLREYGVKIYPTYIVQKNGRTVYVSHSAAEVLAAWKGKR